MIASADCIVNNVAQMQTRVITVLTRGAIRHLSTTGLQTIIAVPLRLAVAGVRSDIALANLARVRITGTSGGYAL